jgi:hypothetical protein
MNNQGSSALATNKHFIDLLPDGKSSDSKNQLGLCEGHQGVK